MTMTRDDIKALTELPAAIIWLIDRCRHAYSTDETPQPPEDCPPYFGECWQFRGNLPYRMRQDVQKFMHRTGNGNGEYYKSIVSSEELTVSLVFKAPTTRSSNRCFFGVDFLQTGNRADFAEKD